MKPRIYATTICGSEPIDCSEKTVNVPYMYSHGKLMDDMEDIGGWDIIAISDDFPINRQKCIELLGDEAQENIERYEALVASVPDEIPCTYHGKDCIIIKGGKELVPYAHFYALYADDKKGIAQIKEHIAKWERRIG